ncbi:PREDICTED: CTD small phosphatase-like protein 2-B [Ficedula albicollis]|uniref:CTD small phosphatase-like protein 2-B n=1 Tax=Ficedula albicollis TaxID=59894 RepID=UPI000359653A|nr:PREDICTED: CTD small phosphatase-like protein 2-B [Ficedula albicollis]
MAGLGATPRTKKPPKDEQEPSTPRAAARGGAKSRQREEQSVPRGWARVPGSPTTPGKGRLVRPSPGVLTPGRDGPKKIRCKLQHTLVLELDGTLLYSSLLADGQQDATATFTTGFQASSYEVHVKLRPHVQEFLESLSKTYEIFIYTTAKKDYAKKLLEVLDPKKKLIRHCLSQSDCVCSQGCYWKDLTRLGRDLAKTVALDHTMQGFPAQAANWISVPPWSGDPEDEELLRLIPALGQLGQAGS